MSRDSSVLEEGLRALPGDEAQYMGLDDHGRPQNLLLALLLQAMLQRLSEEHLDSRGGGREGRRGVEERRGGEEIRRGEERRRGEGRRR